MGIWEEFGLMKNERVVNIEIQWWWIEEGKNLGWFAELDHELEEKICARKMGCWLSVHSGWSGMSLLHL